MLMRLHALLESVFGKSDTIQVYHVPKWRVKVTKKQKSEGKKHTYNTIRLEWIKGWAHVDTHL